MSSVEKIYGPLKTVEQLDLDKFMGKWYVIGSIPTPFERGAVNGVEQYTWNEKDKRVDIEFTFRQDSPDGKPKKITQKGFIYNQQTKSEWRVQPFWPLKLPFLVIELAPDYSHTVIGYPSRAFVWVMARQPKMDPQLLEEIKGRLVAVGYDISKFQLVPQVW